MRRPSEFRDAKPAGRKAFRTSVRYSSRLFRHAQYDLPDYLEYPVSRYKRPNRFKQRNPTRLHVTGSEFADKAIEHNLLVIPGNVFSQRDTHFRICYAVNDDVLHRGIDVLNSLADA